MKKYLASLLDRDYREPSLKNQINHLLEKYEDEQLVFMIHSGLYISDDIVLYFHENVGFRCINLNYSIIGRKPVCNIIEKKLNKMLCS